MSLPSAFVAIVIGALHSIVFVHRPKDGQIIPQGGEMKALGIVLASLAIPACAGLWVAGLLLPMFVEPVQTMVEPYACQEGWRLVTETHTCENDPNGECSNIICVSPDGDSTTGAWPLVIYLVATGLGALLFIGAMVLLIVRMATAGPRSPAA